jgi:hypothetical protein
MLFSRVRRRPEATTKTPRYAAEELYVFIGIRQNPHVVRGFSREFGRAPTSANWGRYRLGTAFGPSGSEVSRYCRDDSNFFENVLASTSRQTGKTGAASIELGGLQPRKSNGLCLAKMA